jgi:hypothetical protein
LNLFQRVDKGNVCYGLVNYISDSLELARIYVQKEISNNIGMDVNTALKLIESGRIKLKKDLSEKEIKEIVIKSTEDFNERQRKESLVLQALNNTIEEIISDVSYYTRNFLISNKKTYVRLYSNVIRGEKNLLRIEKVIDQLNELKGSN